MTLTEFARQLEISPAYWSRIETGRENPPKDELIKKAATILGLSEDELFIEASRLPPDMQEEVAEIVRLYRSINKKP
jgi:transcriptional regulator with XRE-family HTH domain